MSKVAIVAIVSLTAGVLAAVALTEPEALKSGGEGELASATLVLKDVENVLGVATLSAAGKAKLSTYLQAFHAKQASARQDDGSIQMWLMSLGGYTAARFIASEVARGNVVIASLDGRGNSEAALFSMLLSVPKSQAKQFAPADLFKNGHVGPGVVIS